MRKIFAALTFLIIGLSLTPQALQASKMPRYLGTEKKFRSYVYNPNDVYSYPGHYTYQDFTEFEEGETVSKISMGDPSLWLFEHLANRLFLKPVGEDNSQTNMTVITNKHIYHFELTAKEAKSINDKDLIFVAKFVYPDEKDKNIIEFPKSVPSDEPDMRDLSIYNFAYQYTGETSIAPVKVFDNGEFTYFQFSRKNAEVPAIFSVDASGFESLINFRVAGDYVIVEKVGAQFTLRSGTDIVCVYNSNMYSNGKIVDPYQGKNRSSASGNFTPPPPPSGAPVGVPSYGLPPAAAYPQVMPADPSMPNMPNRPMPQRPQSPRKSTMPPGMRDMMPPGFEDRMM